MSVVHLESKYLVHAALDDEQNVSNLRVDLLPTLVVETDMIS